jgi:polysaccharide biosynthesis protein PslJ
VDAGIDHRPDAASTPVGVATTRTAESTSRRTRGAPVTILRTYVVVLVLIPPTYIFEPLGAVGTPATVTALIALMLWVLAVVLPGEYLWRTAVPVRVIVGLLVGTIFLGYAAAHVRYVPGDEVLASDRALLQVLSWAGVALMAAEGLRDRAEVYRVLRLLVAMVAVMAVVGFLQFRAGIDLATLADRIPGLHQNADLVSIQDRGGFRRPAGTATHPIEFGCVIAMALPIALHLARFDVTRSPIRRWLPVAAIAIGIPVAVSRSAVLAAAVAAVVLLVGLDPKLRPRALGAAAAFILVIYATTPGLLGTFRNLFVHADSDPSIALRRSDYQVAEEFVRQSPLIGRGPGTFLPDTYIVLDNQYLMSAIEIGLVGLLVVIVYLLAAAFIGRGFRHRTRDPATRDLGQALAATSLASAVSAFTFDGFSFLMFAGIIPLCLGLGGAIWTMVRSAQRRAGDERLVDAEWWKPFPGEPLLGAGASEAVAGGGPDDDWVPVIVDVPPAETAALGGHGGDARRADPTPIETDDELERLTTSASEPIAAATRSPSIRRSRGPGGHRVGVYTHDLRRLAALLGAVTAVVLTVSLPFVIGKDDDGTEPDTTTGGIATPVLPPVASTSTSLMSTTTTDRHPDDPIRLRVAPSPARRQEALATRAFRDEVTDYTGSRPASSSSSSPTPQPTSPTGGPTPTSPPTTARPGPPTTPPTTTPPTTPPTTTPPTTTPPTTTPPTTTPPTTTPPTTEPATAETTPTTTAAPSSG